MIKDNYSYILTLIATLVPCGANHRSVSISKANIQLASMARPALAHIYILARYLGSNSDFNGIQFNN